MRINVDSLIELNGILIIIINIKQSFDVVIKGGSAVFLFGYLQVSEIAILSIVTLMWLLNFTIPALFGSYFVLNFKFQKSTE